jgi:hypothetical protein
VYAHDRRLASPGLTLALVMLASACTDEPATPAVRLSLRLRAVDTDDVPVAGTRFWADGRELGATDSRGEVRVSLEGRNADAVSLWSACPPAYRTLTASRRVVLRGIDRDARSHPQSDLELVARCEPIDRTAVIAVRVRGPITSGLPILVAGETAGQTEADGCAHLLRRVQPHSSLRVELDTAAHPQLIPRDPVQRFELGDSDSILLFEQAFATTRPPARARRSRALRLPAGPPSPRLPYRIGGR